ncbi:SDR family NAD(P)-dependent oxidoreductase [Streptomyces sp. UH6]|uniref:SDR family NAD(P)-dependent oxidoreductase n=1 Tax=Streptomyces sp. UH6 TaxID=2748379 RepID=UPI0015D4DB34|nr:SDR family NAD(P)-dependent oxidoreductase [Streptomyces sp. UH6]NYV73991.1 SDR family NAD(P)-dependent oxidoreductase [Streptomyces sp. UH6]
MSSIFITGSAQGIGHETARVLIEAGHRVVTHARDEGRATALRASLPGAAAVLVGDLASLEGTRALAVAAVGAGPFDTVIHNAGVGGGASRRVVTADGLSQIFQVNVVAPYLLTALLPRPARLVYLTSGLESQGRLDFDDLTFAERAWDGMQAYSDSKLMDVVLAFAVARMWPDTVVSAVDPGWVRTRLGGPNATDELPDGAATQVWLASSDEPEALATGRYLKHRVPLKAHPAAYDRGVQERLLAVLAEVTGEVVTTS